jgi:hypothetical protein
MTIITLNSQTAFILARTFALEIHAAVVTRDNIACGSPKHWKQDFSALREMIRSIPAGFQRADFISDIRYHFKKIREKRGTDIRGRDYVARVNGKTRSKALLEQMHNLILEEAK